MAGSELDRREHRMDDRRHTLAARERRQCPRHLSQLKPFTLRVRAGDKSAADCLAEYQVNWKLEVIDHQAEIDAGAFGLALIARARLAVRLGSCRAWSMGSRWLRASSLTPAPQGDEPSRRCFLMREVRRNTDH
jgi:hypothetical protein